MSEALTSSRRDAAVAPASASPSAEELLSAAFALWEKRGRGWTLYDYPVDLEPPFCPFSELLAPPQPPVFDDGRRPGWFGGLFGGGGDSSHQAAAQSNYRKQVAAYHRLVADAHEPPECRDRESELIELQLALPSDVKTVKAAAENLLLSFGYLDAPVSFEIIGTSREIVIQFVCAETDAAQVKAQIRAHLPHSFLAETSSFLADAWREVDADAWDDAPVSLIADFGLSNEFFLPLKTGSLSETDLFVTAVGALSDLAEGEVGVVQILFEKTRHDWAQDALAAIEYLTATGIYGKTSGAAASAKEKMRTPLFAAGVRAAGKGASREAARRIVKGIGAALMLLADPRGNELLPLSNDDYPEDRQTIALLDRLNYRSGMLLSAAELAGFVHSPTSAVQSDKLRREPANTKAAPAFALHHPLVVGENHHQNEIREVSLSDEQRTRHIHLIGASGGGKSTLMLNLIKQDLENGRGLCVIDPHGDLIDDVIAQMPDSRVKDVVLFDPADAEYPVGFNILKANSELEKTLLSSDLTATFRRMSTSWGDVMDSVLANAILAFVESERGGTLFELKRFLIEKDFRDEFLTSVTDEGIKYFWRNEFLLIAGKPQSSILIRLDAFLRQKLIRNIVCQKENKIDFRRVMDERKILLVKLSQGLIGEENAYLLGTLLVSKLYQTALSRQDTRDRPFFSCYLDEFHHFITPSMESVLAGVRKYNLGLVLAHQEFRQLQSRSAEVASSVLSNCATRICFRLGDADAEKFAGGFSFFDGKALQNLGIGEAIARVERAEFDFNLKTSLVPNVPKEVAEQRRLGVIEHSRGSYGTRQAEVEANLFGGQPQPITAADVSVSETPKSDNLPKPEDQKPKTKSAVKLEEQIPEIASEINGGHRYLQSIIKRIGESHGFVATLEKQVFGGIGKIDVALESETLKIACEVAATNTPDYELQNIQKCLAANYDAVAVISADAKHLTNIKEKAEIALTSDEFNRVHFLAPEEFHLFLEALPNDSAASHKDEKKVKGYRVNAEFKQSWDADAKSRKQTVFEVLSNLIKRKGKK